MKVTVGGVVVSEQPFSLSEKWNEVVSQTEELIKSKNRETRRHKNVKKIIGMFSFISVLGFSSVARAEGIDTPVGHGGIFSLLANKVIFNLPTNQFSQGVRGYVGLGVEREDSLIWKMNDWLQGTLLNTQDFFGNPQILSVFNSIFYICMSFVTLILTKKGFDMVKARVLGTSTIGLSELIIRLLACVIITFFSLDIVSLGIELSNLTIKTLFNAIESNLIPFSAFENINTLGLVFWFIGYFLMFVILGVQYWIRQITVVMLGCLAPVANTSWVVDGGRMLGTLIREMVTLLTTPLVHGLILSIGSVLTFEVTTMTGNVFIDNMNSVLIGFSTMFLMIFTPAFLRKFITGSANPIKPFINIGKGVAGNSVKLAKLLKK
ncbi:MAG: conjugal transfer protein TrbL family protein [Psychrobacillus sp.]